MRKSLCLVLCICMFLILTSCGKDKTLADLEKFGNLSNVVVEYETVDVIRGDLIELLNVADVNASPKITTAISFDYDVIIKAVHFNSNEMIAAGELIVELDTQFIDDQIMYQEFEIEKEEILLKDLISSGSHKDSIRIKELDLVILELELEEMKNEKSKLNIYAETQCYYHNRTPSEGRKYLANENIVILVNNVEYDLSTSRELNLDLYKNVQIGDLVELSALGQTFNAEVSFITSNSKNYGRLHFHALEDTSFLSRSVYSTIISAKFQPIVSKDILYVPSVVVKNNKKNFVELYKNDIKRIRYIKCGVDGFDENDNPITQVVGGLKEGETVIVRKINSSNE